MAAERFSHRKPFLRVVNGGQRGALARTISTRHLTGHNGGYFSKPDIFVLNYGQVSSLSEHVEMALFIPLREPTAWTPRVVASMYSWAGGGGGGVLGKHFRMTKIISESFMEGPRKFLNLKSLKCHFLDFGEDLTAF
jgi:hypothetical protein